MKTLRLAVLVALFSAIFVLVATVLVVVADKTGLLAKVLPATSTSTLPQDFKQLSEVYSILQSNYVEPDSLDAKKLNEGAIRGMIEALNDPYTDFIAADDYSIRTEDLHGAFGGIGAVVQPTQQGDIVLRRAIPGTPAAEAGLKTGDVILKVNGQSVHGFAVNDVVALIRGKEGTTVNLTVRSGEVEKNLDIIRRQVTVASVEMDTVEGIPYMRISTFSENTGKDVESALKALELKNVPGIIIDLRSNTGGLLESEIEAASQFLDKDQVLLYQRDREGKETERKTTERGIAANVPLVILVDGFTASASEIFAGVMQDYGRAVLIGEKTYGKGSVGLLFNLSDGAGLTVTSARWLTPNRRLIEGQGLEPDIKLADDLNTPNADEVLERGIQEMVARGLRISVTP